MKREHHEEGRFTDHGRGLGTVTEEMVRQRARELALINGRPEKGILDSDLEQARRELQGAEGLSPSPTAAESVAEEDRWNPVPDNDGRKAETLPAPDEQTFAEKLVEEGVQEAEHEQMVQANRENLKRDTQT